ncbi:MAG: sensor domain-containing diguanylate cyclase [Solirubrobacterales bacterium]|nr:sensor domain-containing diguanylate cyclase [Solirubrobacterales bacterium]
MRNPFARKQASLRAPERSVARATGALLLGASTFVLLSLLLPHPSGGNSYALTVAAVAMAIAGVLCLILFERIPVTLGHLLLAATTATTGLLIYESGVAAGQYGSIFVWATLISAYFFSRRVAIAHLVWLLGVYALALAFVASTAGYSPITRWLFTAITLTVVLLFTSLIVAHRARADRRARRFFDLSHDLLSIGDLEGNLLEFNGAWTDSLGYNLDEILVMPFIDLVHPDDRERTEVEAASLYGGGGHVGFENRYRAKDGTWHWLRWSSTLSPEESLVYARATDVTELKRIEVERERLLEKVEGLAHSDALTGLPNRRSLDEQLPREIARARRSASSLCVAIVDVDHFKAYNDEHGHLAGDTALRECAAAWDTALRAGDSISRFGGEEFLAVLPDCGVEEATEIVERLREVTPPGLTCSAGLARWSGEETAETLVRRADAALYVAKAAGRDRLVHSASAEA